MRIEELRLRQIELENESRIEKAEQRHRIDEDRNQINRDLTLYEKNQLVIDTERNKLNSLSKRIRQRSDYSPLALLNIEERYLKLQIRQLELEREVFDQYLEYLKSTGMTCSARSGSLLRR